MLNFSGCVKYSSANFHKILKKGETTKEYKIQTIKPGIHRLQYRFFMNDSLLEESGWMLPYPVFQFRISDVNSDKNPDILVGVIKTTRFDTVNRKRIFIFQIYDHRIVPLWLGSRVSQPLVDFNTIIKNDMVFIRTIERERKHHYLVAEYRWKSFGLEFMKYIKRNVILDEANVLLKEQ